MKHIILAVFVCAAAFAQLPKPGGGSSGGGGSGTTISGLTENVLAVGNAAGDNVTDNVGGCTVTLASGLSCPGDGVNPGRIQLGDADGSNYRAETVTTDLAANWTRSWSDAVPVSRVVVGWGTPASTISASEFFTLSGNGTALATVSGSQTVDKQLVYNASGNIVVSAYDAAAPGIGMILATSYTKSTIGDGISNYYFAPFAVSQSTDEQVRALVMPVACTVRNVYVCTHTTMPADTSLIMTVRQNAADSALALTIPAGSVAACYSASANVSFAAGDTFGWRGENSGAGSVATAQIKGISSLCN